MEHSRDILNCITFGLSLILLSFMIPWYLSFYYLRNTTEIYRRRPTLTLLIGFLCICGALISHNVNLILLNFTSIEYIPFANLLVFILVYHTTSGVYHLLSYRAWLVYYEIKWNKAMEDSKWRCFIDPTETDWFLKHKNSWGSSKRIFIIVFVHWAFWGICGITSIIIGGPSTPSNKLSRMAIGAAGCVIITVDTILYFKMPSFNDIYKIHDEMKLLLRYKIIFLTSFFIITLVLDAHVYTSKYVLLANCGIFSSFGFTFIMFYYVFKRLKLPANPYHAKIYELTEVMEREVSQSGTITLNKQASIKNAKKIKLKQILQDKHGFNEFARYLTKSFCVENLIFFVETHQWLVSLKEQSEYEQFEHNRKQMDTVSDINKPSVSKYGYYNEYNQIMFPESAPKSRIIEAAKKDSLIKKIGKINQISDADFKQNENVFDEVVVFDDKGNVVKSSQKRYSGKRNTNSAIQLETYPSATYASDCQLNNINTNDIDINLPSISEYLQCIRLFKKYVANDAYFCINIDSAARKQLFGLFGVAISNDESDMINMLKQNDVNKEKLFHMFDDSREQIYSLLNFAFARFKATDEFEILTQTLITP